MAFAISGNCRFVALGERIRDTTSCQVSIYSLSQNRRIGIVSTVDTTSREILRLTFGQDPKHLLIQYGSPEYSASLVNWERGTVLAGVSIGQEVHASIVNPYDMAQIVTIGPQLVKMWRLVEGAYKGFHPINMKRVTDDYSCGVWFTPDTLMVGTRRGDLLLIDRGSLDGYLPHKAVFGDTMAPRVTMGGTGVPVPDFSPQDDLIEDMDTNDDAPFVVHLITFSGGFVASSSDGRIAVFHLLSNAIDLEQNSRMLAAMQVDDNGYLTHITRRRQTSGPSLSGGLAVPSQAERRRSIIGAGLIKDADEIADGLKFMPFRKVYECYVPTGVIKGLSLAPNEETLAVSTANGLYTLDFARVSEFGHSLSAWVAEHPDSFGMDVIVESDGESNTSGSSVASNPVDGVDLLGETVESLQRTRQDALAEAGVVSPAWFAPLTPLLTQPPDGYTFADVASCLPRLILASKGCIQIVDISTRRTILTDRVPTEVSSLAIHPNGLHAVVCCPDGTRVYHICTDSLVESTMWAPKSVKAVAFNRTGSLVALAGSSAIVIHDFLTGDQVASVPGHAGTVTRVAFTDDGHVISAGHDGAVYHWDIKTGTRSIDAVVKLVHYTDVTGPVDGAVVAAATDGVLREIVGTAITHEIVSGAHCVDHLATLTTPTGRLLLAVNARGGVSEFALPLRSTVHRDIRLHSDRVVCARVVDNTHLVTVSVDGSIVVCSVRTDMSQPPPPPIAPVWAVELISTEARVRQKALLQELVNGINDMTEQSEFRLRQLRATLSDTRTRLETALRNEQLERVNETQALRTQILELEQRRSHDLAAQQDVHTKAMTELELAADQKVRGKEDEVGRLLLRLDDEQCRAREQQEERDKVHAKAMDDLKATFSTELDRRDHAYKHLDEDCTLLARDFEVQLDQQGEEYETEISELKGSGEMALAAEKARSAHLKGQTLLLRKRFQTLSNEIQRRDVEIADLKKDLTSFQLSDTEARHAMQHLQTELRDRDAMLSEKEKRIFELKQQNKELDKFKYVLDYKVREMRQELEPRDVLISDMRDQIASMDAELEDDHRVKQNLERQLKDATLRAKSVGGEVGRLRERMGKAESFNRAIVASVHNIVHDLGIKEWPDAIRTMYHQFCAEEADELDEELGVKSQQAMLRDEMSRQREHLEKTVQSLKRTMGVNSTIAVKEQQTKLQENVELIGEINELRQENRLLAAKVTQLQSIIIEHRRQTNTRTMSPSVMSRPGSARSIEPTPIVTPKPAAGRRRGVVLPVPSPARVRSVTPITAQAAPTRERAGDQPGMMISSTSGRGYDVSRMKAQSALGFRAGDSRTPNTPVR